MELFRQRLLESTTRQSDLVEIFSAIDRGKVWRTLCSSPSRSLLNADHSGHINYQEFCSTLKALHVELKNEADVRALFQQFDTTNNGEIDLKEFLRQLRPAMSERRQRATNTLFDSMDMNKDGTLTVHDLKVQLSSPRISERTYRLRRSSAYRRKRTARRNPIKRWIKYVHDAKRLPVLISLSH